MIFGWYFCEIRRDFEPGLVPILKEIQRLVLTTHWETSNLDEVLLHIIYYIKHTLDTIAEMSQVITAIIAMQWSAMRCNSYLVTWLQLYKNSTWWHDWRKRQWFNGVTVRQWKRVRNLRLTLIVLILIMVTVCNTGCWWCWLCWHWWWLECWSFWWWCR